MGKEIKRYSDVYSDERRNQGWWYFTTHGVQPGSVPKGVNILEVRDTPNGTYFRADAILNTSELEYYDIKERVPKEEESLKESADDDLLSSCKEKYRRLIDIADSASDFSSIKEVITEMFNEVGGKVHFEEVSNRYASFSGGVNGYSLWNSVSLKYQDGDLHRLAEDLTMAFYRTNGGQRVANTYRLMDIISGKVQESLKESTNGKFKFNSGDTAYTLFAQNIYEPVTIKDAWFGTEHGLTGNFYSYTHSDGSLCSECPEELLLTRNEVQKELDNGSRLITDNTYKKPANTKINIRESLNKYDLRTDNKYDLRNLYDACIMTDKEKRIIAEMISKNTRANVLYEALMNKFEGKELKESTQKKSLKESHEVEYLERELAEKSLYPSIEDAYERNELTICKFRDSNTYYLQNCPNRLYRLVKREMGKYYPELKYLYDESLKEAYHPGTYKVRVYDIDYEFETEDAEIALDIDEEDPEYEQKINAWISSVKNELPKELILSVDSSGDEYDLYLDIEDAIEDKTGYYGIPGDFKYEILERPQIKIPDGFKEFDGYATEVEVGSEVITYNGEHFYVTDYSDSDRDLWVSRNRSDISKNLGRSLDSDEVQFVSSYYGESLKEAESDFNTIKKNAISATKRDGYNQVVTKDKDGKHWFHRDYPSYSGDEEVVGKTKIFYKNGVQNVDFFKEAYGEEED